MRIDGIEYEHRALPSLVFVFCLVFASLLEAAIIKGPYLQNVRKGAITICWETENDSKGTIYYGPTPDYLFQYTESFAKKNHEVTLSNLNWSSLYHYKVVCDGTETEDYTFRTAALPGEPFKVVAYGDNRTNDGDHQTVVDAILSHAPDLLLNTGDLVEWGFNPSLWQAFFNIEQPLISESPLYAAFGNHEIGGNLFWERFFSFPTESSGNEHYYSFEYGNVNFICIDSTTLVVPSGAQYDWLVSSLQSAAAKPHIDFTILFFHYPVYSCGNHGSNTFMQQIVKPLLEEYEIPLVFNGHDHDYEHALVNGVNYIVTGGGGAPLYGVDPQEWTIYAEKTLNFCVLDVSGPTINFTAYRPDGTEIESFIVTAPPTTPPTMTPTPTPTDTFTPAPTATATFTAAPTCDIEIVNDFIELCVPGSGEPTSAQLELGGSICIGDVIRFSSSDPAIATVGESSGLVQAVSPGEASIEARCLDCVDTAQVSVRDCNHSPTPTTTPTSTITPTPATCPAILLGGYWQTRLNSPYEGTLNLVVYISDSIDQVGVYYQGEATGFYLYDDGYSGDLSPGDGFYGIRLFVPDGMPPLKALLEVKAKRGSMFSQPWPYLVSQQ